MALYIVTYLIAALIYIWAKILEKLKDKIGDYVVEKMKEYIVAPVRDYLVAPIGRRVGYLLRYNTNIEDFRNRVGKLESLREEVQGLADAAVVKGEVILPKVQNWLTSVKEITEQNSIIPFDEEKLHVNLKLRYQRSKIAKERTADVDELIRQGSSFFDRVSTCAETFESRRLIFEKIREALKDDGIKMIGIYGMAGVGKTTIAKEVGKQADDDNLFDEVVMVAVSADPNLERIQGEIADALGLGFDEKSDSGRARRLCAKHKEKKRVLVILDDVWGIVDLDAMGIPFGAKIVLTCRKQEVCNQMGTDKNFSIEVLSEQEGWNLFKKMAGVYVDSRDIRPLAVEVAKECAGLPLAIVTVARALRNKRLYDWSNAANQLRNSMLDEKVISSIELSYNNLESEEAKSFFLLCCIFPEDWDIEIQDLMKYGMGLDLFQHVDTVDEARARAYALTHSLKSSCLLQDGSNEEHVKMHDVIRDFAISIASKDKHVFLVRAGPGWKVLPKEDKFKRYTTISIKSTDFHQLPIELDCPKLQILYIECPHPSLQFPYKFFMGMENLKVLDMSGMHFSSLPCSLCYLKNLRTLCLDRCFLDDISIIGKLKKLEILSFLRSNIKQLPKEIGTLTHLRLLDLTKCKNLTVIPPNVIQSLSQLEGLYMDRSFQKWEMDTQDGERSNASLAELKRLTHLINLEIEIPNANLLPEDLLFQNLSRFKVSIGTGFSIWEDYPYSKILKIKLDASSPLQDEVNMLLKRAEHLILMKMKGLKNVLHDLNREGFQNLKCFKLYKCNEVEYIFNGMELVSLVAFPILEKLSLSFLANLKEICHGQLPSGFFSELQELTLRRLPGLRNMWKDPAQHVCFHNLRIVKVEFCDGLKNLFSHSVAKDLSKLVELQVRRCKTMEEILGNEKDEATEMVNIELPDLRSLKLQNLPNLKNFCSKMKGDLDSGTEGTLFNKRVAFPALEKLIIFGKNYNFKEIWHPQLPIQSFSQLKVLNVEGCHKVLNVVPFNLLQRLRTLEELNVRNCDSVEEVVEVEGLVVKDRHVTGMLSQLRILQLRGLPKLKHMWWDKYPCRRLDFQNLSSIIIFECNSLRSLFSPSISRILLQLKEVQIDSCEMMEVIIAEEIEEENCTEINMFPQLNTLKLQNLPKLINFMIYTGSCTLNWSSLKVLSILGCPAMKTFTSRFPIQQKLIIKEDARQEGNLHDSKHPLLNTEVVRLHTSKELKTDIRHPQLLFNERVAFTNLEVLQIDNIENLQEIFHSELSYESFPRLKILLISKCHKLLRVATSNFIPRLKSLEELFVGQCNSMEEIFGLEGLVGEGLPVISLFCLKRVELSDLHTLKIFCSGNCNLEFPSLETLSLVDCPEMQTFSSAFVRTPKLNTVILNHSKEQWKGDLNSTVQHLFQEKGMLKSDIKSDWEDEEEVEEDEDEEEIDDDDDDDEIGDDNDDEELEEEVEKEENTTA